MGSTSHIRILYLTRWTVHAESMHSILPNYDSLQKIWKEVLQAMTDMEAKARIQGLAAHMTISTYLFGSTLSELALKHTDNLSRTLPHVSVLTAEGQQITAVTVATLTSMWSDNQSDLSWVLAILKTEEVSVSKPQMP